MIASGCSLQPLDKSADTAASGDGDTLVLPVGAGTDDIDAQQLSPIATAAQTPSNGSPAKDQTGDIWTRISSGMSFADKVPDSKVEKYLNWYSNNQTYIDRVSERANRYIFHILEELERNNLPSELALLPVVESAYNPFAYSHSSAAGLWQFIPDTGRHYGLRQDWWFEGRRDVMDSTAAAIAYLGYLHDYFEGDWLLALAAYNSGEGNVRRAIARNRRSGKATDFWSLSLPRETRAYVPQLLAIAKIIAEPAKFAVTLPPLPDRPYFESVAISTQVDLAEAARLADISVEEMYLLNPGHNRWVTPPAGPNRLLLPVEKADRFAANLAATPENSLRPELPYVVKKGDTLSQIASRHSIRVADLKARNNLSRDFIKPGQILTIAGTGADRPLPFQRAVQRYYKVRKGDSLWKIARKMNVSVKQLRRWNSLDKRSVIRPGQRLAVRSGTAGSSQKTTLASRDSSSENTKMHQHSVSRGDSLYAIAARYNVRIGDILSWNGIRRSDYLQPGQVLKIYPR